MRLLILAVFFLCGCSLVSKPKQATSPSTVITPQGEVTLKGDAKDPAKVNVKKTDGVLNLPEASRFDFNEKTGLMSLTLSKATQMVLNRTETAVEGPVAFEPNRPPTAKEEAEAKSDAWIKLGLYACVLVGGIAFFFGLARDWNYVMYGGVAVLGSGLFGLFVQRHPLLLLVIGLGVALKFVGPIIWHTKLKNVASTQPKNEAG